MQIPPPIAFQPRKPKIGRKRHNASTSSPAPAPAPAHVVSVTGNYGDDFAVFTFDQPLVVEGGASFDMFYLSEAFTVLTGTGGVLLDPFRLKIIFDGMIDDTGNAWAWTINPAPEVAKIHTALGEAVEQGTGEAEVG
ncbi:MAG TPA: hypothetical protein VF669_04245 [Tepidisphaeraceae bacterium]|jgi:hypothetical protein